VLEAVAAGTLGPWDLAQLLAGALLVAPLVEELVFRGVLLPALCRLMHNGWGAIAFSGVLFGFIHAPQPQAVLPLATVGVVLGFLRLTTGRVWPCILAHALFNGRTMAFMLLAPEYARQ
jgi:membrane protease YdiL (CAAX protease family)